jgi:hypothetical protein
MRDIGNVELIDVGSCVRWDLLPEFRAETKSGASRPFLVTSIRTNGRRYLGLVYII